MMSALRTRRQPQWLASDRRALRATSSKYDDTRLRVEEPLEEMVPSHDLPPDGRMLTMPTDPTWSVRSRWPAMMSAAKTSPCRSSRNEPTNSPARAAFSSTT